MTERELCARNVSAALREAMNASRSAKLAKNAAASVDDQTTDLIETAVDCLERAFSRLAQPPKEPAPTGDAKSGN